MKNISHLSLKDLRRVEYIFIAILLALVYLIPAILLSGQKAGASQLTSRYLSISSGVPAGTSVQYTYGFTYVSSSSPIQSIKFVACTTAVDTYGRASSSSTSGCTAPSGMNINQGTQQGSVGGSWTNSTGFTRDTSNTGFCNPANNVLCITRTQAANESAAAKTITWNTQTNMACATSGCSFFVGIYLYSTTTYGTPTDSGTVASAVSQTLTVNAAVAEVLNFCVGSTSVDNATSTVGADCSNVTGTSVNIGTLDTGSTNVSPITTNGGDSNNGVAMIRTNASSGAVVQYDSIQQSGSNQLGTLRVNGASCNASSATLTDQCIRALGTTQATITAGTENFGMTIGAINCGSTTAYSCVFSSGTYNLARDAAYDGNGTNTYTTDSGPIASTTNQGYAWDDTGTFDVIASSAGSTTKVIDDEAMILKFAATPSITTPFGSYAAQADFVAVATY